MVWPTHVRHRERKHAFEEALDEAELLADDELADFVDASLSNSATGPAVGSLGDIAVAASYVAPASLARAYGSQGDEAAPEDGAAEQRPAEAAAKLKEIMKAQTLAAEELRRVRRQFAAANHPDRVAAHLRDEAVSAMAEINAEIDRALKQLARSG